MTPTTSIPFDPGRAAWTICRSAVVSTATSVLTTEAIATSPAHAEQQPLHRHQPRLDVLRAARRPKHQPDLPVIGRESEGSRLRSLRTQDDVPGRGADAGRAEDKRILDQLLDHRLRAGGGELADTDVDVDVVAGS